MELKEVRKKTPFIHSHRHHSQPMFTLEFMEGRELRPTR